MKIAFATLGCKVNQYETQALKGLFAKLNFDLVDCSNFADVYVLNSCTVTARSDAKLRQMCFRFKRINPAAILMLAGCFAQALVGKNNIDFLNNFDVVVGNFNKFDLPKFLEEFLVHRKKIIAITKQKNTNLFSNFMIEKFRHNFRAFVKIEDGCNRGCSYCVIPRARGFVKSKPLEILKFEVEKLASNDYREIVLVGINLSSYGFDFENKFNLVDAVEVVSEVKNIERVRLSSLEPDLLTEEDIIRLSKNEKFCPNFHLALQSGSDSVLKRMGRKYGTVFYLNLVEKICEKFKNPSFTTDVMVGFPQETEKEFLQTLNFIERIGFLRVHIFPYSKRPGTVAAMLPGQIAPHEKKLRAFKAKQIAYCVSLKFLQKQIGNVLQVLFESVQKQGIFIGHSKNYCLVKVKSSVDLIGEIKFVKINYLEGSFCVGKIV